MIGGRELMAAAQGHVERMTPTSMSQVKSAIYELDVDGDELAATFAALIDLRDPEPEERAPYSGGMIDGFTIGIRAARIEAKEKVLEYEILLTRYSGHDADCRAVRDKVGGECDCGFDAAISRLRK